MLILEPAEPLTQQASAQVDHRTDQAIRKRLEGPPFFWDKKHPGPTLVPRNLPKGVFPMDCRAAQAFLHRVNPGQYHFQRAQYLLGEGPDFIGCEAFGLARFQDGLPRDKKGVEEALAASRNPMGLEVWRPSALRYVLAQGYHDLARDYEALARKRGSQKCQKKAEEALEAAKRVEKSTPFEQPPYVESQAGPCPSSSWFDDVVQGKAAAVRKCLSSGTPADWRGPYGMTALMYAALNGQNEVARILLAAKADPNARDNEGSSPLRDAVATSHASIVGQLLAKGAKVNRKDTDGTTALMDAAAMGFSNIVGRLIAAGASVNLRAHDGSSALLETVEAKSGYGPHRSQIIGTLIAHGSDVNIADWRGDTHLMAAARSNDAATLAALVQAGARLNTTNREGETALYLAAREDAVQSVSFLLAHRANPNLANHKGETPLMVAANHAYPSGAEIVNLLVSHGADVTKKTRDGMTALMYAASFVRKSEEPWPQALGIFRELLSHVTDVNATDNDGGTALMDAAQNPAKDNPILVAALVKVGADINTATKEGTTALMDAAEEGHPEVVRFLISHGANVNARDAKGRYALDYAADYHPSKEYIPGCIEVDFSRCAVTREVLHSAMQKSQVKPREHQ